MTAVAASLDGLEGRWRDEYALQRLIAARLEIAGHQVEREVRLTAHDRIDLLVDGDVGVEVKIDGSVSAVQRQLVRYAQHPSINSLVLVTTKALHRPLHMATVGAVLVEVVQARWV